MRRFFILYEEVRLTHRSNAALSYSFRTTARTGRQICGRCRILLSARHREKFHRTRFGLQSGHGVRANRDIRLHLRNSRLDIQRILGPVCRPRHIPGNVFQDNSLCRRSLRSSRALIHVLVPPSTFSRFQTYDRSREIFRRNKFPRSRIARIYSYSRCEVQFRTEVRRVRFPIPFSSCGAGQRPEAVSYC